MPSFIPRLRDFASNWERRVARRAGGVASHMSTGYGDRAADPHASRHADHPGEQRSEGLRSFTKQLYEHSTTVGPLVKYRIFSDFPSTSEIIRPGWVQMPELHGRFFSIGLFLDSRRFCQLGLADGKGRVFLGSDTKMDTQVLEPALVFGKEGEFTLADNARSRVGHHFREDRGATVTQGSVVGRDPFGQMSWLASWIKDGDRYTLEQMRLLVPRHMRVDLEYRDALSVAFFSTYMLPQLDGRLMGFGAGNIFRRLNHEAPLGAIRRSVKDSERAKAVGLRVSGLEDYFEELMADCGALRPSPGLEVVHGAEPLHLFSSSYSGNYFFSWDDSLDLSPALEALDIEAGLNRFAAVSLWLERNMHIGSLPVEDTVTRDQAARIDQTLLDNPALLALNFENAKDISLDESSRESIRRVMQAAEQQSVSVSQTAPLPVAQVELASNPSEWIYRQSVSTLLRRLKVPYRFETEFRSNLYDGEVAVSLTSVGEIVMPARRYDGFSRSWRDLDDAERAALGRRYNLRVGLIVAAMCFGAGPDVDHVSIRMDSMGLDQAVKQQDSAISKLIAQALGMFERGLRPDHHGPSSKADPKDGDFHGDPAHAPSVTQTPLRSTSDSGVSAGQDDRNVQSDRSGSSDRSQTASEHADSSPTSSHAEEASRNGVSDEDSGPDGTHDLNDATVDSEFESLMQGIDMDSMAFQTTQGELDSDASGSVLFLDHQDDGDDDDPMSVLRNGPTMRNMASVTFTRDRFLARMEQDGLDHPEETYRLFGAQLDIDDTGDTDGAASREHSVANAGSTAQFTLRDKRFSPFGSGEEPEFSEVPFTDEQSEVLGCRDMVGLSIQRADLMQRAVSDFHRIAVNDSLPSVAKANEAMEIVRAFGDPELADFAPTINSALIDGTDTPDLHFTLADEIDRARLKTRDLLFSGEVEQALEELSGTVAKVDAQYAGTKAPRYFNSYAERVVYNRLFATSDEHTVLIPDNLFYAHMELADMLAQLQGAKAALPHLNALVAYAPAYPLSHLRLAVQLAREEDWNSARAACLNALRVCLDRDDAAYAYYRLAYAEWMSGEFAVAVACYIMSEHISPNKIGSLDSELQELLSRARSQCILVPTSYTAAQQVLEGYGVPVWPRTQVADIVRQAAQVCVDGGMFVPARTLSVAAARMNDSFDEGIDMAQAQFLRSLSA